MAETKQLSDIITEKHDTHYRAWVISLVGEPTEAEIALIEEILANCLRCKENSAKQRGRAAEWSWPQLGDTQGGGD